VRALALTFSYPMARTPISWRTPSKGFPCGTLEEFLALLRAQLPDLVTGQPAPDALSRFLDSRPTTRAFLARLVGLTEPDYVEITAGLPTGDMVVNLFNTDLKDGQTVGYAEPRRVSSGTDRAAGG
jgi:hypothetical protein